MVKVRFCVVKDNAFFHRYILQYNKMFLTAAEENMPLGEKGITDMIYIALCEDDADYREIIAHKIEDCINNRFRMECRLDFFTDLETLEAHLAQKRADILFLDVMIGDENAMDWSIVHLAGNNTPIVFMTSFPENAYNISETNCCYFLVKSRIDEVSLTRALQIALQKTAKKDPNLTVIKQGSTSRVINYADIQYIETFNNNLTLHLSNEDSISVYSSLKEFADRLPPNFLRCHKSFMVNMNHIVGYAPHTFHLKTGDAVPIPPKKYKHIISLYRGYLDNMQ